MKKEVKRTIAHPDLTRIETAKKSVGAQIEPLLKTIDKYSLMEIRIKMVQILDDPKTHVSPIKANQYKADMARIYNLNQMRQFVTNVYLSAANLSLKMK